MTTKVKIEIVQAHLPVAIDLQRPDGSVQILHILSEPGQIAEEYVHSGQSLIVREIQPDTVALD